MFKKIAQKMKDNNYKSNYGEEALKNRERVSKLMEEVASIPYSKSISNMPWEIRTFSTYVELDCMTYDEFHFKRGFLSKNGLLEYEWLIENPSDFIFSLDELPLIKQFQELIQSIEKNRILYFELLGKLNLAGKPSSKYPEINVFRENEEKAKEEMRKIINPISRKIGDNREEDDVLKDEVLQAIQQAVSPNPVALSKTNYQLESLRQLQLVVEDDAVSKETKSKAKKTMELIEDTLKTDKERQEKEWAEMNAEAVIQASLVTHRLPNQSLLEA